MKKWILLTVLAVLSCGCSTARHDPAMVYRVRVSGSWGSILKRDCHHYSRDGDTYFLYDAEDNLVGEVSCGGEYIVTVATIED